MLHRVAKPYKILTQWHLWKKPKRAWRFQNPKILQGAYETLKQTRRVKLHQKAWLTTGKVSKVFTGQG
jgi:hypothetical protein